MFKSIKLEELNFNFVKEIRDNMALITAGSTNYNTMTIGWMTVGVLWGKNVNYSYVRESRYTYKFMEENDYYTICFFDESKREDLVYLGRVSGRDLDKVANTSLTAINEKDYTYFKEAKLVLVMKKISERIIPSTNIPKDILGKYYSTLDYHKEYIGEIVNVLINEK